MPSGIFFLPFSFSSSMITRQPRTFALQFCSNVLAAVIVPPVAIKSSMTKHFKFGFTALF